MKKIWRENDKSEGICPSCRRRIPAVFAYRTVELENPRLSVADVLVSVCQPCGTTVSVPWQSNQRLQTARKIENERLTQAARIEARVPGQLYEALRVVAAHLEAKDEAFSPLVLRYYLSEVAHSARFAHRVCRLATCERSRGPATERISLKLSSGLRNEALKSARRCGVHDQSALMRGLIAAVWEDVFEKKARRRLAFLENLASATR